VGALVLLVLLVFLVYFLGEHAGTQSSARQSKVDKVTKAKADLDIAKNDLHTNTTPPALLFVAVLAVIGLILMLFGAGGRGNRRYRRRWEDD
jgi:hypothetical protein